jgi:hypothetical protein
LSNGDIDNIIAYTSEPKAEVLPGGWTARCCPAVQDGGVQIILF